MRTCFTRTWAAQLVRAFQSVFYGAAKVFPSTPHHHHTAREYALYRAAHCKTRNMRTVTCFCIITALHENITSSWKQFVTCTALVRAISYRLLAFFSTTTCDYFIAEGIYRRSTACSGNILTLRVRPIQQSLRPLNEVLHP